MTLASAPAQRGHSRPSIGTRLVLAGALLYTVLALAYHLYLLGVPTDGWRLLSVQLPGRLQVSFDAHLAAAPSPLRSGDVLVAVEGQSLEALIAGLYTPATPRPVEWVAGRTARYTVLRDGREQTLDVPLIARPPSMVVRSLVTRPTLNLVFLAYALIGIYVILRAPSVPAARILFLFGVNLLVASWVAFQTQQEFGLPQFLDGPASVALLGFTLLYQWLVFPLLVHLFLVFPIAKFPLRRYPRLTLAAIYGVTPALDLVAVAMSRGRPLEILPRFTAVSGLSATVAIVVIIASALHSRWSIREPVAWAQVRWMVLGILTTIVGAAISSVLVLTVSGGAMQFSILGELSFVALPVTLAIAILRYRLFDIDVVINRTLVYGSLTGALIVAYFGGVTIFQRVLRAVTGQESDLAIIASTLFSVALALPLRRRIQTTIDRRFYRRKYDIARTLAAFGATVRDVVDLDTLATRLVGVLRDTMLPAHVALWLRPDPTHRERHDALAGHNGEVYAWEAYGAFPFPAAAPVIAPGDPLLATLAADPGAVAPARLGLDSPAAYALAAGGTELVVPLVSRGEVLGLLDLGRRLSGQGYSADDRALLNSLAAQATPAVKVAQLVRQQQAEQRERDRIEHELLMARDIQLALLPKTLPTLPGWEILAHYQPAHTVGGDFYDFLELPGGRLGIVVGDAMDKGMPAALVMAATRTIIRTVARRVEAPAEILAQANAQLRADLPQRLFVTCLFAVLDPATGHLRYANAGHLLPMRCTAHGVDELTATGLPLGAMPDETYDEREAVLAPGEQLVLYSDGLVEAHSPAGEIIGFPGLAAALAAAGGRDLLTVVLDRLVAFTGPAWEQEDDVTLVTLARADARVRRRPAAEGDRPAAHAVTR